MCAAATVNTCAVGAVAACVAPAEPTVGLNWAPARLAAAGVSSATAALNTFLRPVLVPAYLNKPDIDAVTPGAVVMVMMLPALVMTLVFPWRVPLMLGVLNVPIVLLVSIEAIELLVPRVLIAPSLARALARKEEVLTIPLLVPAVFPLAPKY